MGTSLSGLTPATTFDGLLKVGDNDPLTADLKAISTGDGADTILQLSNSALSIGGDTEIDSSGLNALIVKRNGTELLKSDGSGLNGGLIFTGNLTNKFSLGVNGNDFNIWDGSYLGGGDLRFSILADGKTAIGAQTPTAQLHIKGSGATSATTSLLVQNSAGADVLQTLDNGSVGVGGPANSSYRVTMTSGVLRLKDLLFGQTGSNAINNTSLLTMKWNGSTGIGISGGGAIDATARLHVKGSGNTNTTTSLLVENSDGAQLFKITDNRDVYLGSSSNYIHQGIFFQGNYNAPGNWNFGTASDLGAKLGIKGSGATSATTALLVQNSAGAQLIKARDDSQIQLGQSSNFTIDGVTTYNRYGLVVGSTSPESNTRLFVKGSGNDATTTALLVQNSDGTDMLKVLDNGQISASGDRLTIGDSADVTLRILASGNAAAGNNYIQPLGTPANQRVVVTGNSVATIKAVDLDASNVYIGHGINQTAATGTLSIKGSGTTSATAALLVENSAGTDLLKVADDGGINFNGNIFADADYKQIGRNTSNNIRFASGETRLALQGTAAGNRVHIYSSSTATSIFSVYTQTQQVGIGNGNTALDSTAKLQVDSTTQGFLPPRMTDAERDAITNPAAGLMVYDTSNNQMNYWNGSTWIAF